MKKIVMLSLVLSSLAFGAPEYSIKLGLDPYRTTTIDDVAESANLGGTFGAEVGFRKNRLTYGLGIELRTKTNHKDGVFGDEEYYSHPVYGLIKYDVADNAFYLLGRLGRAFNTNTAITDASGNYFAFGIGKSIGNFDLELVHEATETVNNDKKSNLAPNLGLFKDGNFETLSFKVAYVLGRKDTTGPEVDLKSEVTENKIIWNYGVKEKKAKVTEVYLNGQSVPVKTDGIYVAEGLPTGRYTLEVVAVDKYGNISKKSNSVILVDNNDEKTKKELEEFIAGERSLPIIVGYEANVTELTPAQKKRLQDGVYVLDGLKGTLSIMGYTDDTGTEELNLTLSKERAETVAGMVKNVVKNPSDIKIVTVGKGETNFKVTNDTDENRKLNRRIEFEFKADDGEIITNEKLNK